MEAQTIALFGAEGPSRGADRSVLRPDRVSPKLRDVPHLACPESYDLRATLRPLHSGWGDPTLHLDRTGVARATRTPEGPATWRAEQVAAGRIEVGAWGPGADWALSRARDALGLADTPPPPAALAPELRRFAVRAAGIHLPRTHRVLELLVLIVLQQLVTGKEAARAYRNLVRFVSEPAPGPFEDLWLPPSADRLRALAPATFPPLGIPARHGETLRELGWRAARLEECDAMTPAQAERRLLAVRGLGPWSAGSALLRGMAAPDAVPIGDIHLPNIVAYNLTGQERADDARMLELLEPYRGMRGRALRWILAAGRTPPRRSPRPPLRPLPRAAPGLLTRPFRSR